MRLMHNPAGRHTVNAAQIATVSNRDSQVSNFSSKSIYKHDATNNSAQ